MVTARQIRAGRALLGWSQQKLADHAILSLNTIRRIEGEVGDMRVSSITAIEKALHKAGVEFLPGEGVRLAPVSPKRR